MKTYKYLKSFGKGLVPAVMAYAATQVGQFNVTEILSNPKEQLPNVAVAFVAGAIPAVWNMWKHRKTPGNPFYRAPGYFGVVLMVLLPAFLLGGCETITDGNGTVTRRVDTQALTQGYLLLVQALDRLDARADAQSTAEAQQRAADRAAIERQLAPLRDALLQAGVQWVQEESGKWRSVRTGRVLEGHVTLDTTQ